MAWVCDYCGGPPDGWSGGQGERERCADGCGAEGAVRKRRITIVLSLSEEVARHADEASLAALLGRDAASQAKALIAEEESA